MYTITTKARLAFSNYRLLHATAVFVMLIALAARPALAVSLSFHQALESDKGFVSPVGVTTDGTSAFVADYGADKVFKIDGALAVTTFLTYSKPLCVAFYNSKIYVVGETGGGNAYNSTTGVIANIPFGANLIKPADMAIGSDGKIYVVDTGDRNVKVYNATTGAYITAIGGPYSGSGMGVGEFYAPAGIYFDSTSSRLVISDAGNPTPYIQVGQRRNPFTKQFVTSSKLYGKPKGKVQVYDTTLSSWKRMFVTHGGNGTAGQVYHAAGVWGDANYLYTVDSINKKILITDNAALDAKVISWGGKTQISVNEAPVMNTPDTADPATSPTSYTGAWGYNGTLASYDSKFVQFKDVVKVGSYLVVTDTAGRVFYFTIGA